MDFTLSTWMMIAFVVGLLLSAWKLYSFMPTKKLQDDDTGEDSYETLKKIMRDVLLDFKDAPALSNLYNSMKEHKEFDEKKFWRFNENKLRQLLNRYYLLNEHQNSIEDIHADVHSKKD